MKNVIKLKKSKKHNNTNQNKIIVNKLLGIVCLLFTRRVCSKTMINNYSILVNNA